MTHVTTVIVYHGASWVVKNYEKTMSQKVRNYTSCTITPVLSNIEPYVWNMNINLGIAVIVISISSLELV